MIKMDGKALSEKILEKIKIEHEKNVSNNHRKAGLAVVIVGNNSASKIYVNNKIKACDKVGFNSKTYEIPDNASESELLEKIEELNNDNEIDGILVQLPLPKTIDELKILNAISPKKDVDGFHPMNVGKMLIGDDTGYLPCTPYGIIQILEEYDVDVEGKDVVVVGRSNIVGKPIAIMLIQKGATVQVCNTKTKNINEKLKLADIIIAAAGVSKLIKKEDVKNDVVIIDVGMNRYEGKLCGDVDYESVIEKASYITPVPGGVGPMTIASLIKNTYKSYMMREFCKIYK